MKKFASPLILLLFLLTAYPLSSDAEESPILILDARNYYYSLLETEPELQAHDKEFRELSERLLSLFTAESREAVRDELDRYQEILFRIAAYDLENQEDFISVFTRNSIGLLPYLRLIIQLADHPDSRLQFMLYCLVDQVDDMLPGDYVTGVYEAEERLAGQTEEPGAEIFEFDYESFQQKLGNDQMLLEYWLEGDCLHVLWVDEGRWSSLDSHCLRPEADGSFSVSRHYQAENNLGQRQAYSDLQTTIRDGKIRLFSTVPH